MYKGHTLRYTRVKPSLQSNYLIVIDPGYCLKRLGGNAVKYYKYEFENDKLVLTESNRHDPSVWNPHGYLIYTPNSSSTKATKSSIITSRVHTSRLPSFTAAPANQPPTSRLHTSRLTSFTAAKAPANQPPTSRFPDHAQLPRDSKRQLYAMQEVIDHDPLTINGNFYHQVTLDNEQNQVKMYADYAHFYLKFEDGTVHTITKMTTTRTLGGNQKNLESIAYGHPLPENAQPIAAFQKDSTSGGHRRHRHRRTHRTQRKKKRSRGQRKHTWQAKCGSTRCF